MSMAGLAGSGASSAHATVTSVRRFHRHEQLTVRMEPATALHHSAQRPMSRVVVGPREGEVHVKHDGLRARKRPLPGTRPEPPEEVSETQAGVRRHTGVGFELMC